MKIAVFWDVALCIMAENYRFEITFFLLFQDKYEIWTQQVPPKCRHSSTRLNSVTYPKAIIFIFVCGYSTLENLRVYGNRKTKLGITAFKTSPWKGLKKDRIDLSFLYFLFRLILF
jgi:hypothetical protein